MDSICVEGQIFRETSTGKRWTWAGCSDFSLLLKYLHAEPIGDILQQRRDCGANLVRVFGMMHYIHWFHPQDERDFYPRTQEFLAVCERLGFRVELVVFADAQEIMPDVGQQREHFARLYEAIAGTPNVFVELVNEWPKNGIDPMRFAHPGHGLICSRGSGLSDEAPPMPGWDYHTWHGRRDWPKVLFSTDDMWYVGQGIRDDWRRDDRPRPVVHDEPIGFAPQNEWGRRSSEPSVAWTLGTTAALYGAGGTFHSQAGLRSELFDSTTYACGRVFFEALHKTAEARPS